MDVNVEALVPVAITAVLVLASVGVGLLVRRTVLPAVGRHVGAAVVATLRGPVVVWSLMLGVYLAARVALVPGVSADVTRSVLVVLLVLSVAWSAGKAAAVVIGHRTAAAGALPSVRLLGTLTQAFVLVLGALVALQTLGISVAPLLTALGVGGLAVGLALQDTLTNLFAGLHILVSRQIRPGDYVRLESGEEGYVQDLTWRYTTIRQLGNNVTIVPNARLASAIVTNYDLPESELAVLVPVGVSYGSDLGHVEAVTTAVGREVMAEVPGGVATFAPFIRYNAFSDSSITFTVILRGRTFVDQHLLRHEFIKRLHRRYEHEGIEIPFPIRTVHLQDLRPAAPGA
jgi:small-conductance mechanosensitive channel